MLYSSCTGPKRQLVVCSESIVTGELNVTVQSNRRLSNVRAGD